MLEFIAVILGCMNLFFVAVVIYILKQPDAQEGRELAEIAELRERIAEISRALTVFERKVESMINETRNESMAKMDTMRTDVSRQLQEIHNNL